MIKQFIIATIAILVLTTQVNASLEMTVKTGQFGCQKRESILKLVQLAGDDREAAQKIASTWVLAGECIIFHVGETVFWEGGSWNGDHLVQVRLKGNPTSYWSPRDLVGDDQ